MDLREEIGYLRATLSAHIENEEKTLTSIEKKVDFLIVEFHQRKGAVRMLLLISSAVSAVVSWAIALWVWPRG